METNEENLIESNHQPEVNLLMLAAKTELPTFTPTPEPHENSFNEVIAGLVDTRSIGQGDRDVLPDLEPTNFFSTNNPKTDSYFKLMSSSMKPPAGPILFTDRRSTSPSGYRSKPAAKGFPSFSDDEFDTPVVYPSMLRIGNGICKRFPTLSDDEASVPTVHPSLLQIGNAVTNIGGSDHSSPSTQSKIIPIPQEPVTQKDTQRAKLPPSVSPTGAVTMNEFCEFLKSNGQDSDKLGIFGLAAEGSKNAEDYNKSVITIEQGDEISQSEEAQWSNLQNVTITVTAGTFKNSWANRISYGGRAASYWQNEARRKAIELGGWNYDEIEEFESNQKKQLHPDIVEWINRAVDQKFDPDVKLWIYLKSRKVWDPARLSNKGVTERAYDSMLSTGDLAEANPYNNFFLRFYDFSPVFPFRQLQSSTSFRALCKDIKHTISGAKSNVIKKIRRSLPVGQGGELLSDLSGRERRWMKGLLDSQPKRLGFRTYSKQPEVRAKVEQEVEEIEAIERDKCRQEGLEYVPIDTFSQREKAKLKLWNQLSDEQKESWRKVAGETDDADKMTDEEQIHLAQKLLVRAAEALAGSVGMHVMIYTSYVCDGEPYATSIECGESPYGRPFHKTQHAAQHQQMKAIFCDGAAIRAGTDASKVQESFIPRSAALQLADEEVVETDIARPAPTIILPSLTFDKNEKDMNKLSREMARWIKNAIEAVHGRKLRSTGDFSMKFLCRRQEAFFENFPMDDDGRLVRLGEFEAMQDDHLIIWRDHLIESYSTRSLSQPFRFKTIGGQVPKLSMLRMGTKSSKTSSRSKRSEKRGTVKKDKQAKTSRRKKTLGRKSVKSGEDSNEEEESMTDGSETFSDEEEVNIDSLPPRTKTRRKSSEHAALSIEKLARKEAKFEEQNLRKVTRHRTTMADLPLSSKSLPGSAEQKAKKAVKFATSETDITHPSRPDPDPTSLYLQTKGMTSSTLIHDWRSTTFSPSRVKRNLKLEYSSLIRLAPCGVALREPHKSLPALWTSVVKHSSTHKEFSLPSLFDLYASEVIFVEALTRSSFLPVLKNPAEPFPKEVAGPFSNTLGVLLHALGQPYSRIPTSFRTFHGDLPEAMYDTLTSTVLEWVDKWVGCMATLVGMRSAVPNEQIMVVIRCMAFSYNVNPFSTWLKGHTLYHRVMSTLGARCVFNYVSLILSPIVFRIQVELGKDKRLVKPLVEAIISMVGAFLTDFPISAASACDRGDFFTGSFPNMMLSKPEADMLDFVLRRHFWCCTNVDDFPLLIVSPRGQALVDFVLKIALKYQWEIWTPFDKFCCLVVTLSAAIPFLNGLNTGKSRTFTKEKQERLVQFVVLLEKCILNEAKQEKKEQAPSKKINFNLLNDSDEETMENHTGMEKFEDWVPTEEEEVKEREVGEEEVGEEEVGEEEVGDEEVEESSKGPSEESHGDGPHQKKRKRLLMEVELTPRTRRRVLPSSTDTPTGRQASASPILRRS